MLVSYWKKPRRSKSSEIIEIEGLSFFLYNTKTSTKGLTEIYLASEPYPLITIARSNNIAKLWLESNMNRIKAKLVNMSKYELISREEYLKAKPEDKKDGIDTNTVEDYQIMHNKIMMELRNELDV